MCVDLRFNAITGNQCDGINRHADEDDGNRKVEDEPFGFFSGFVLLREEIHFANVELRISVSELIRYLKFAIRNYHENETFGASFCSGLSMTNNSAGAKLNVPAIRLLGNTSRLVL